MNITEEMILKVCGILNQYDFTKLISAGCPYDEYYPEAKYVLIHMSNNPQWNKEDIAKSVQEAFKYYFCGEMLYSFPIDKCREIAEKILKII